MARGVNKVILIGNLGNDPEVRYTPNGNAVANVTLATSTTWRDKQTGELQERTEWHTVAIFSEGLVNVAERFLRKGSKVFVEGQLQTRKWQDKNGIDRYTTEVIANEMHMLDSRSASGHGAESTSSKQHHTTTDTQQASQPKANPDAASADFDDDIPF